MNDGGDDLRRPSGMMVDLRVLVAEDDYLLADELARVLLARGAEVVGPAPTLRQATRLAVTDGTGQQLDGALLNVNLRGEMAYPLADVLLSRAVPVVLVTGYDPAMLPAHYAGVPCCQKPVEPGTVLHALLLCTARRRGSASPVTSIE